MLVVPEVVTALQYFISSFISCVLGFFIFNFCVHNVLPYQGVIAVTAAYALINSAVLILLHGRNKQIAFRSAFLGTIFAAGVLISLLSQPLAIFGWYVCVMSFFHYSEFIGIAVTNPKTVTIDSFMLNHSTAYIIAAVTSWSEYLLELVYFPELKMMKIVSITGLVICIVGEVIRKSAMATAKSSFDHIVQYEKKDDHILITHGIYSFCRHPAYVGWFYWCLGTQLILVNPLCFVLYAVLSWMFFRERIPAEEMALISFFGDDYVEYMKKVPTGLPFISGYEAEINDAADDE